MTSKRKRLTRDALFIGAWLSVIIGLPYALAKYVKAESLSAQWTIYILLAGLAGWVMMTYLSLLIKERDRHIDKLHRLFDTIDSLVKDYAGSTKDDMENVQGGLDNIQAELDRLHDEISQLPRGRGRPRGFIYPPNCDKGLPIKDALPVLAILQDAYERGELRAACEANPWGGPAIPETTARGWLDRYQNEIEQFTRNSRNYS